MFKLQSRPVHSAVRITDETARAARVCYELGDTYAEICERFKMYPSMLHAIIAGRTSKARAVRRFNHWPRARRGRKTSTSKRAARSPSSRR